MTPEGIASLAQRFNNPAPNSGDDDDNESSASARLPNNGHGWGLNFTDPVQAAVSGFSL